MNESMKFQFRAELQNAFNIRGFGPLTSVVVDPNFDLVESADSLPRQVRMSLSLWY